MPADAPTPSPDPLKLRERFLKAIPPERHFHRLIRRQFTGVLLIEVGQHRGDVALEALGQLPGGPHVGPGRDESQFGSI